MAKQVWNVPFAAKANVIAKQDTLKRWEAGLAQAKAEGDASGIEFCERAVAGAKKALEKAKEDAYDITLW